MCLSKCGLMVSKSIKLRQVSWHCLQLNGFTEEAWRWGVVSQEKALQPTAESSDGTVCKH